MVSEITQQIKSMCEVDRAMRERAFGDQDFWDDSVDLQNTEAMKKIIDQVGWPTISIFGEEASDDAWLLVQHADHDVQFQEDCLVLIKALPAQEVNPRNIAYLEDRIRVNKKQPQLYGTQFNNLPDGSYEPRPVEDFEHIDERRKALGIESFEEYRKMLYEKYGYDPKKREFIS